MAVLSYRYWQKRFSGDAGIVGKQINLNQRAFTIIGVTPSGFDGTGQVGDTRNKANWPGAIGSQLAVFFVW